MRQKTENEVGIERLLIASIVAVSLAAGIPQLVDRGYHDNFGLSTLTIGIGGIAIASGLTVFVFLRLVPHATSLLKILLLLGYSLFIYSEAIPYIHLIREETWVRTAIAVAVCSISVWLTMVGTDEIWKVIGRVTVTTCAIFIVTPFAIGSVLSIYKGQTTTFSLGAVGPFAKNNVLVLLLDETSPEYAHALTSGLSDNGFFVINKPVAVAGKNTINAIPSMLTTVRHDDATICNLTTLCGYESLDFSMMRAKNAAVDVVGFYHPYCSIGGLRSCYLARPDTNIEDSGYISWSIDRFCTRLQQSSFEFVCGNTGKYSNPYLEVRRNLIAGIYKAPFWSMGGLLYVHMLLPHMPSQKKLPSIKEAYEANIEDAAVLLKSLTISLKDKFGDDFLLIVISDHPFRNKSNCTEQTVNEAICQGLPPNRGRVPILIITSKPVEITLPGTNLGLLAK
jgi:hypothetical protein